MSTYCSDFTLNISDIHGHVDVAHCCFGSDVRLTIGIEPYTACERLSAEDARALGLSLIKAAASCEQAARIEGGGCVYEAAWLDDAHDASEREAEQ